MNKIHPPSGKVLVTGANGFIGKPLCTAVIKKHGSVRAAARISGGGTANMETTAIVGIDGTTDWTQALQGIQVVVHLAARAHKLRDNAADPLAEYRKVNVDGTLNLAGQALQAGVKRFIFISTIKVNGEQTLLGRPFRAEDKPSPEDAYAVSKREAEDGLRALCAHSGMDFVIIRPPLVYGPGVKGNFLTLLRWLDQGLPLPLGSIRNKRSLVAVNNLVDLIVTCLDHPSAANQTFLASDGEDLSTPELLHRTASAIGRPARLFSVPIWILQFVANMIGKESTYLKLCTSLQVDIVKTREILGWTPPVKIDQALRSTVKTFLETAK